MKWLGLFRRSSEILRPIETQVLSAVAEQLPPNARKRFLSHVEAVNKVQRHTQDREVNLYHIEAGKARFDDALRFPVKLPVVRLATVWLQGSSDNSALRAEVWLATGHVFSVTFDRPPTEQTHGRAGIEKVRIWLDPMEVTDEPSLLNDQSALRAWLGPRAADGALTNVRSVGERSPLEDQRDAWDTHFPSDVRALFEIAGGFNLGNVEVRGISLLRSVILDDGEFIILAERADGKVLALKRYESSGLVYLMDPVEETTRRVPDFRTGLDLLIAAE